MTWLSIVGCHGWILLILLIVILPHPVSAASGTTSLTVVVKDERTRETLDRAQIYLDGGYRGEIAGGETGECMELQDIRSGMHTLRILRDGYKEKIIRFRYPDESVVEAALAKDPLVVLNKEIPSPHAINVVFYPSATSYNCTDKTNVSTRVYFTNETKFREDVQNVIRLSYLELDYLTDAADPLPENYRDRFNFYYYYDPSVPADAFTGCTGTIPAQYWNEITFSDLTVILYPTYYGRYSDSSCQPVGCTQDTGTAHNVMKVPADKPVLFSHETGHALYGLIDTYCGDTYYAQNDPYPNVWTSVESCIADARLYNRDPGACRQIQKNSPASSASCSRSFWQWDPAPDIMANGYSGTFGAAATQRINYILSRVRS